MKRYALVVSLALLFAAFMWSCQQQDSAPLSPEGSTTLGKGKPNPKPEPAIYTIEVFFGDNPFVSRNDAVASSNGTLVGKHFPNEELMDISQKLRSSILNEWTLFDGCMSMTSPLGIINDTFTGQLRVIEYGEEQALGNFTGENDQGFFLLIEMVGKIISPRGWVLPKKEGEALVVTGEKVHFRFEDDGKGKNKKECGEDPQDPPQAWRIVITITPSIS